MIERELANVFDLTITRPTRLGPGGDQTSIATVADGLCAIHEQVNVLSRSVDGHDITISDSFVVDPVDNNGDALEVQARDRVQWTDYKGSRVKQQQVFRVSAWYVGAEIDHLLIETQ